jgi:hypothetical protein
MASPVQCVILTQVAQTCFACPSQWDAWDADGRYYHLRYRHGCGQVRRYASEDWYKTPPPQDCEVVADFEHGGPLEGCIGLAEFCALAGLALSDGAARDIAGQYLADWLMRWGLPSEPPA